MRPSTPILHRLRVPLGLVAINVLFAAAFIATALSAFHAPTPHAVPVGIVAPAQVTAEVRGALQARAPGGFDLHSYPQPGRRQRRRSPAARSTARSSPPRVTDAPVAQAGGSAPAQLLTTAFTGLAAKTGRRLDVVDVVPPLKNDSLALSSFFTILCVLFPSLATGAATAHLFRRHRTAWRIAVPAVAAAAIGLSAAAIAAGVTGFGDYLRDGRDRRPVLAGHLRPDRGTGPDQAAADRAGRHHLPHRRPPGERRARPTSARSDPGSCGRWTPRCRWASPPTRCATPCTSTAATPPDTSGSSPPGPPRASHALLHSTRAWLRRPALSHPARGSAPSSSTRSP